MRKKQIFILSQWMRIDGVAASLLSRLKELDYSKVEVDLCLMHHVGPWMKEVPKEVHLLPEVAISKRFTRLVRFLWYWGAGVYYRAFRKAHVDPVGSEQIMYAIRSLFGWYPKKLSDRRYDECWIYGGNPDFARRVDATVKKAWVHEDWGVWKPVPLLARSQFKNLDYVVNVSDIAKQHFDALGFLSGKTQSIVIENVLSTKWLMERAAAYEVPDFKGVKLLSVGRASAAKNFGRAVETARILKNRGLRFKWVVVGDGEELESLRKKVADLEVGSVIELVGGKDNTCPYYRWCDIYICTSDTEAKSVTVCEAQAMGKPVIMTNFPTAGSHVRDEKKDIVVNMSPLAIAKAVIDFQRGVKNESP